MRIFSGLPFVGSVAPGVTVAGIPATSGRDYLSELGVRRFINASGTYTAMTGSLMHPEVLDAMRGAADSFVMLEDLQERVSARISSLLGCEAAMVTAGAASALTLGTAAVLTGNDPEKFHQLPDLTGMNSEVIIQKSHRFPYEHAVRNCGVRMVEVETAEELRAAVNPRTALLLFLNANNYEGQIRDAEFVELGRSLGLPTFNDCAADVPPVENLWKYTQMGFDLVTFSGGKGIRGPQSAGLLLGRKHLIGAARLQTSPHADTIGRGMKVNKEEIVGMLVALELYLKRDHEADRVEWERRAALIRESAASVNDVEAEVFVPRVANHVPHIRVSWSSEHLSTQLKQIQESLRGGDPSIEIRIEDDALQIGVWMMEPGEAEIVSRRLKEVLEAAV